MLHPLIAKSQGITPATEVSSSATLQHSFATFGPMPSDVLHYRSLRTHITTVFGAFTAVMAVTLCLLAGELLKWRMQQQAGMALRAVASNAATILQQDLLQQVRRAQILAQSKELWEQGLASRSVADMLARLQHINPHNVWIGVADADGIVQNATAQLLVGANASQWPWFQQAQQQAFISHVHTPHTLLPPLPISATDEPLRLIDYAAPIHDPDGKLLGVLGIHTNWNWIRDAIERLLMGANDPNTQQSIFIFDHEGAMIYAPQGAMAPYEKLGQSLPTAIDRTTPKPLVTTWKDSERPFLTAAVKLSPPSPAQDVNWWVVARQPVATAYADAYRAIWMAIGCAVVAGLLAAWIAWRLASHVSDDLKQLAQAASQIQSEGAQAHIPLLHSNREVFKLSQALSNMTEQLVHTNAQMQEQVLLRTEELQALNAELRRQANTDALTKLLNRRGFEAQARLALARARRTNHVLSAMSVDIDFFKRVNDRFGHEVGDIVLAKLGEILQTRMRETDIVARIGGEEFIVLMPDTSLDATQQVAQELLHTIAQTEIPPVGFITVSAGVSTLHRNIEDGLHEMIKRSDDALYMAKNNGRNRVCRID